MKNYQSDSTGSKPILEVNTNENMHTLSPGANARKYGHDRGHGHGRGRGHGHDHYSSRN